MTRAAGLGWAALMRLGLKNLGLHPAEFWALTPAELQVMLGADAAEAPLLRGGLETLMAAYPDKYERNEDARF